MSPRIFWLCCVLAGGAWAAASPVITGASPDPIDAGGQAFLLAITGTGFVNGAVARLSGTALSTTFVSSTQLSGEITPALRAISGHPSLTVVNPDGGVSNAHQIHISPVIGTVSPAAVMVGSPAFSMTVTGIGLTVGDVLIWSVAGKQTAVPTKFVDSKKITALIPANLLNTAQSASIQIAEPLYEVVSATSLPFAVLAAPAITSLAPNPVDAGGVYFRATVTGTGFIPTSVVNWAGTPLDTIYVSATQLQAAITPELRTLSGTFALTVADPGFATSNSVAFTVSPVLFTISPASASGGGPAVSLTVTGVGFTRNDVLLFNGASIATAYVSPTTLTGVIPAAGLRTPGMATVQVSDSAGVGRSLAQSFTVLAIPPPAVGTIAPAVVTAGSPSFTLTVSGAGFVAGSMVLWNGTGLATSYIGSTQLTAFVNAEMVSVRTGVNASITVVNPGGAASNSTTLAIDPPRPSIVSLIPTSAPAGSATIAMVIAGSNFAANCVARWNGAAIETSFIDSSRVSVTLPSNLLGTPGVFPITVTNPSGLVASGMTFTVIPSTPSASGVSPASVMEGGPAFTLTVNGTYFTPAATVIWNSSPLVTAFVNTAQVTALVPSKLVATAGSVGISVSNAGGLTSKALSFEIVKAPPPAIPAPTITAGGVVNAFSSQASIAPGALISIYGTNLAPGEGRATGTPLPQSINGTSVSINGAPAPLLFVSATQINAQAPFEISPGTAGVVVRSGTLQSAPVNVEVRAAAPGILTLEGGRHALAVNYPGGTLNSAENPVRPGEYVVVYVTGQGVVDRPVPSGTESPADPLVRPLAAVKATLGGVPVAVAFAGLAPGFVGLLQVNLLVPEIPGGEQVLDVTIGGAAANATVLSVANR